LADAAKKIQTSFSVWQDKFDKAYDKFVADLDGMVTTMRTQGISEADILARIETMISEGSDVFGAFSGDVEKYADDLVSGVAQTSSNDYDSEELLAWVLDPDAKDHCDDCISNEGTEPQTFAEWEVTGLPGAGNTECAEYCKCTLEVAQ
jgi:hypothetical protein